MTSTTFSEQLKQVHDLLVDPSSPRVQALCIYAKNQAQTVLIKNALDESGCAYTVLVSHGAPSPWMFTATGSHAQLLSCVETLLGY